ncbi:hypothetical protein BpHYR1_009885 [Brachionus plicatilis]|uniref:Uncharacterized protein n=1 Tax=Brachionus plicatilis TaxID=10195 RepID=A0A3M7QK92_BRAPC|nr:hypothetical protein BpHYR1_009885 [Brachionus plicatilis]
MKLLLSLSIFVLLLNLNKLEKIQKSGLRFSVACGRFQDNEKLFFGMCTLNENSYDRIVEFVNYVLKSDPNLDLDNFLRNYLFANATKYFRQTYPNASYIQKLDLFESKFSLVMDKLKTSLSQTSVAEFFDAAKTSNFSQVLKELVDKRDQLQLIDWDKYQEMYCNQGVISFCKSAKDLLDVTYVSDLPMNTVLEILEFYFERAYITIDYLFLLPEKDFVLKKLKKIDSQGTKGTLLSEVHEIINTRLFNNSVEYFTGSLPSFTTKKPTTTTIKKTTTKQQKVLEIVAVDEAVYLSIPLTILGVTIIATVVMVVVKKKTTSKKNMINTEFNLRESTEYHSTKLQNLFSFEKKMTSWQLILVCLMHILAFTIVDTKTLFIVQCNKAQKNELLFFGTCNGQNQNIYPKMMDIVSKIKKFNPESTLNQFLTNYIFSNSSEFFEKKYKDNSEYLSNLSKLKTELTDVVSKMEESLSNVTIADFILAFQKSSFNYVIEKIITDNDNFINSLELNNSLRYNTTCQEGTFCQLTTKILNVRYSNELSDFTIKQFLNHLIQNGFNYLDDIFLTSDKLEAQKNIEDWNNKGSKNIKMSEVAKFIDNRLIKEILYVYEPFKTTKKKTTTKFIRKTTTRRQKVIDEVAVSDTVLWTIPMLILLMTILGSVGVAYYFYKFKPVLGDKANDKIIQMETKKTNF